MYAKRRTIEEQLQLVMECRSSGLSDYQWCSEHDINPGTFYNWVSRLRKKACEVPDAAHHYDTTPMTEHDVVKVSLIDDTELDSVETTSISKPIRTYDTAPVVIKLRDASISLQNSVDPQLLKIILEIFGGQIC